MSSPAPTRVLVVTDRTAVTPELLAAIRARAERGPIEVARCSCPNPAPAEWHPTHPERHAKADAAQRVLEQTLPSLREAAGRPDRRVRLDPARPDGRDRGAAARRADRRADHRDDAAPHRGLAARRPAPSRRAPRAAGHRGQGPPERCELDATRTRTGASGRSLGRRMLNKVPEVTLFFWIIKIMCTTVGETAADYLNDNLGFGLTNTTYVTGALLVVAAGRAVPRAPLHPGRLLVGRGRDLACSAR